MKRALILTVGTGTRPDVNIVKPLCKTIKDSRPDYTVFILTSESEKYAREIAEKMFSGPESFEFVKLEDFDDFQKVFKLINRKIRDIHQSKGFEQDNIQVDFTSGTKAMTSGLVLSAYGDGSHTKIGLR